MPQYHKTWMGAAKPPNGPQIFEAGRQKGFEEAAKKLNRALLPVPTSIDPCRICGLSKSDCLSYGVATASHRGGKSFGQ